MSIKILSCHAIFSENAIVLSQRFSIPIETNFDPKEGDLYIVLGGHEQSVPLHIAQQRLENKFGYIILNSEQPNSPHWRNKYYITLCRNNPTFNYSMSCAQTLKNRFKIEPFGFFHFDYLTWAPETIEPHEHYDIVFIGAKNELRENIHKELVSAFPDKKILFHYDYEYNSPQKISSLLANTDVFLNIPYYDDNILATHRINKGISHNCKVVSFFSSDDDMNEFYKEYIYFSNDIPKLLKQCYEKGFEQKKNWEDLSKDLGNRFYPTFQNAINHIHNKLKAKLNKVNQS